MEKVNLITEQEKRDIELIGRTAKKYHIMTPPVVFLELELKNRYGDIISSQTQLAKSWVRNAYNLLMQQVGFGEFLTDTFGAGYLTLKDTGGGIRGISWGLSFFVNADTGEGNTTLGIVVGSSDTAESFESYALGTIILHGETAGKLYYSAQSKTKTYNAGTKKITVVHIRSVSGNPTPITVKETGMYANTFSTNGYFYVMALRDVLTSPVTINDTETLTVTYKTEQTFPY